jgi:hypothetical protein
MKSTNCDAPNMQFLYPPAAGSHLTPNTLSNTSFLDIPNRTKFYYLSKESNASSSMAENNRISSPGFGDVPV